MTIQHINPPTLGNPSHYGFTNLVVVPENQKLVFIAGQSGADEQGHYGSFDHQLKRAFEKLRKAVAAVDATPDHIVKITILCVDYDRERQTLISAERNAMWPDDVIKPASTIIPVPCLSSDAMLFEIDAIAAIP
ncbi:MAG: RidA family protein [Phormidesmis sp.]